MTVRSAALFPLLVAAGVCAASCTDAANPSDSPGAKGVGEEGRRDAADGCAEAVELEASTNPLGGVYFGWEGAIDHPGDRDAFRVPVQQPWMAFITVANAAGDPDRIDTVLNLLDDTGTTLIATNDTPRADLATDPLNDLLDAALVHRFVDGESSCLELMDYADWAGENARGGSAFSYKLFAFPIDGNRYDDWNVDHEPNDTADDAQTLSVVEYNWGPATRIVGALDGASDVDIYRLVSESRSELLSVLYEPWGPAGNGADDGPGIALLRDEATGAVVASLDLQTHPPYGLIAEVEPERTYLLEVERGSASPSDINLFYHLSMTLDRAGALAELEPNDDFALGRAVHEAIPFEPSRTRYHVSGLVPAGDVDWWPMDVLEGDVITVRCDSWRLGSGVRDFTVSYFEPGCNSCGFPAEEPARTEVETEIEGVHWSPIVAALQGAHFLRISSTLQADDVGSTHYLCDVVVQTKFPGRTPGP